MEKFDESLPGRALFGSGKDVSLEPNKQSRKSRHKQRNNRRVLRWAQKQEENPSQGLSRVLPPIRRWEEANHEGPKHNPRGSTWAFLEKLYATDFRMDDWQFLNFSRVYDIPPRNPLPPAEVIMGVSAQVWHAQFVEQLMTDMPFTSLREMKKYHVNRQKEYRRYKTALQDMVSWAATMATPVESRRGIKYLRLEGTSYWMSSNDARYRNLHYGLVVVSAIVLALDQLISRMADRIANAQRSVLESASEGDEPISEIMQDNDVSTLLDRNLENTMYGQILKYYM